MLTYVLKDEMGRAGQNLAIHQGEIKTLSIYWFNPDGTPAALASVVEIVAKIFMGISTMALSKTVSGSGGITLISGDGGTIGCKIALSAANTLAMPVSATIAMSLKIEDSASIPAIVTELDLPAAFSVTAPLVP